MENLRYNVYKNKIVIKIPAIFMVGAEDKMYKRDELFIHSGLLSELSIS